MKRDDLTLVESQERISANQASNWITGWLCLALSIFTTPLTVADEAALDDVIERHWQWVLEQYPERRLEYGDRSGNASWTDRSPGAFRQRYEDEGRFVSQLEQIEPATLSADGRVNRSMLLRELRDNRSEFEDGLHLIALDMRSGPQHWHSMIDYLPMETEAGLP